MGAIGIQYYGVDSVLEAAKNFRCAAWAIFIRSSLFMKFEDDDLNASLSFLEQALISLEPGGTDAIYTIKFFEPAEGGKALKINEKSVCTAGGFTFKLTDPVQREQRMIGYANSPQIAEMSKRMERLEQMFEKLMTDEPEPEPETVGTVLVDALKNPEQLMNLINAGKMLLGFPVQQQPPVHAIGNVNSATAAQSQPQEYSEELILRLQTAVSTLEKNDPKLVEHLEKLAAMSENDKGTFSFLISMLDKK
jgi:hypothetical protein